MTVAAIVVIPCTVSIAGKDSFRDPKEYLLRAAAILAASLLVAIAIFDPARLRESLRKLRPQLTIAGAVLLWTAVTTLTSTNRRLSYSSLLYVACCAVLFIAVSIAFHDRALSAISVLLIPAVINTVVLILQEFRIWDMYPLSEPSRRSALIGNPNDVGAYLLCGAIVAAAACFAGPGRRLPHAIVAALLAGGIVMTQSVTAIVSYSAAIVVMGARLSWKSTGLVVAVVLLTFGVVVAADPPLRTRAESMRAALGAGDYNTLTSYRLTAFAAALQMLQRHPITGVGPGCYGSSYFEQKIAAEARHPVLHASGERVHNFGEAHSDLLQTGAVAGIPGLIILGISLVFIASISFRGIGTASNFQANFARICSLPLAVGVAVLMVAQFPLELAASSLSIVVGAALCTTWSRL